MRDREQRLVGQGPKCHFFNTFFLVQLFRATGVYKYDNVERWTRKEVLCEKGQVYKDHASFNTHAVKVVGQKSDGVCTSVFTCTLDLQKQASCYRHLTPSWA